MTRKQVNYLHNLNLQLAWDKVKDDFGEQCFIEHPFEIQLIESYIDIWLTNISNKINSDNFNPSPSRVIDIPKPDWHYRPGNVLALEDNLIYSALLLDMCNNIKKHIGWSEGKCRCSNILKESNLEKGWVKFVLNGWNFFREKSLQLLGNNCEYVVFTDIAAFFEHISIQKLTEDLEALGAQIPSTKLLNKCLNRWAGTRGRGIPQGFTTSNILGEVYLNTIDKRLASEGICHLRYVDDIRIFCKDKKEAIKALHCLIKILRKKGLNLQTSKSKIVRKNTAIRDINGVSDTIKNIKSEIIDELRKGFDIYGNYTSPSELKELKDSQGKHINLESLIEAFNNNFSTDNAESFNKSLFHYILNRLAALDSPFAIEYCLKLLNYRPEETKFILAYFEKLIAHHPNISERLSTMLSKKDLIYKYQEYLIMKWLIKTKSKSKEVLNSVRTLIRSSDVEETTIDCCIYYLGENGEDIDHDYLESLYAETSNILTKATILYSLKKMHKAKRNSIYGRAKGDGHSINQAIGLAKIHS